MHNEGKIGETIFLTSVGITIANVTEQSVGFFFSSPSNSDMLQTSAEIITIELSVWLASE